MGMHRFRELKIWQRSMDLAENIYLVVAGFPTEEKYGLTSQLKRCARVQAGLPISNLNFFLKWQWVPAMRCKHRWSWPKGLGTFSQNKAKD